MTHDVDVEANNDDDDGDGADLVIEGLMDRRSRWAFAAIGTAGLMVAVTFLLALGAGRPGPDLGVVVVTDPVPRSGPTPVLAMVVGPGGLAPFEGTVNGRALGARSIVGIAEVPTSDGVEIVGTAQWQGGLEPVALRLPLAGPPLATTLTVVKTPTLAIPSLGATVHPVAGLVPPAGPAEVVLVDDDGVRVVVVDVGVDGRLPDGRLLAVDRRPWTASLDVDDAGGDVTVAVVARSPVVGLVGVAVGGRVRGLRRVALAAGETTRLTFAADRATRVGDVVVANVSTAIVPGVGGATDLQLVGRVGGLRDEDLLTVEPRARPALGDPRVREALGRRLVVEGGAPTVVSPSLGRQRADRLEMAQSDARAARGRLRVAAAFLLGAVVLGGVTGTRRPRVLAVLVAVLLVGAMLVGLDRVLDGVAATASIDDVGADAPGRATSGSP